MNVYDTANTLAREIKESKEYKEYKNIKQKVFNNPELKDKISEFEKLKYDVQVLSTKTEEDISNNKDKIMKLQELYTMLAVNSEIKEYFDLEVKFNIMIADVNRIIAEAIRDIL